MDVQYHEEFVRNPRGVPLFTCGWLPVSASPKALVFLCHGYGMECSDFMRGDAHVAQTISTGTLFVPLITGSDDDDSNLDVVQQPEI